MRETSALIRRALVADRPDLLRLIHELIPDGDPAARWDWLYRGNPQGRALTWVATDGVTGALAGVTSYFPFHLWVEGHEELAALGGDGYVRPAYRRRGIAAALHAAARGDMEAFGIQLMFGAPTAANVSPLKSGGSRAVAEVVRYLRPLEAGGHLLRSPFARGALRWLLAPRRSCDAALVPALPDDPRIDEVWRATRDELAIATVRDARFYTWRFLRSPSQRQEAFVIVEHGQPVAVCALERLGDRLRIVDLVAPACHWPTALAAIAHRARGCAAVEIKLLREDATRRRLWSHGFIAREAKPFLVVLPPGSIRRATFHDPARWFYSGADSDIDTLVDLQPSG